MKIASLKTKELSMKYTFYSLDQTGIWHAKKHILIHISHNFDQHINICGSLLSTNEKYPSRNWAKTMMTLLYIVRLLSVFPRTDFYEIFVRSLY